MNEYEKLLLNMNSNKDKITSFTPFGNFDPSYLWTNEDMKLYPKENLNLAQEIVENGGLLLSEYAIGQSCGRYGLVARDRLQAGLAKATIVVQTGVQGGTMHAVNATLASGTPLFAVEYRNLADTNHEKVQGNIMLIRDKGAIPLRSNEIESAVRVVEDNKAPKVKSTLSQPKLFD